MIYIVIAILITIFSTWRVWVNIGRKNVKEPWWDFILMLPAFSIGIVIIFILSIPDYIQEYRTKKNNV